MSSKLNLTPEMQNTGRVRFPYLDGVRGICAVIIALYHAAHFSGHSYQYKELSGFLHIYSVVLSLGHFSI
jgi:peptidoglycan/LPS O-acetylase OafA/YrhL